MLSPKYVKVLAGPIGGGKSVTCVYELLRRAQNQQPNAKGVRRSKWLIVRNTAEQLKQTTFQTFTEWVQPGVAGEWKVTDKTFYLRALHPDGTIIEAAFLFIALDTPDDVRKALSLECTGLWGNECRELNAEVVDGLISRANRFPPMSDGGATEPGAIFDTNMPELESWWGEKMTNPPENWSIHIQPPALIPDTERVNPNADNLVNLAPTYYTNLVAGKPPDWINVYLRVKYGFSQSGLPVFRSFKEHIHVAKKELLYNHQLLVVVGLDPGIGGTGAAIGQMDLFGRMIVLDEIVCQGVGAMRFVDDYLKPLLKNKYPGADVVISIDPAADNRTQIDEMTVANSLRKRGFKVQTAHTNKIDARISAVDFYFNRLVDGEAALLINASCKHMIRALAGGYRYNVTKAGVTALEPCKDKHSHICFVAGTKVATPEGEQEIEKLRAGDTVLTPKGDRKVTRAWMSSASAEVCEYTLSSGRSLVCTPDHPVMVKGKGFVPIDSVLHSDMLEGVSEENAECEQNEKHALQIVAKRVVSERVPVFALTVEGCPVFYAEGVLAHNCDGLQYLCCYFQRNDDRISRRQAKAKVSYHHKPASHVGY